MVLCNVSYMRTHPCVQCSETSLLWWTLWPHYHQRLWLLKLAQRIVSHFMSTNGWMQIILANHRFADISTVDFLALWMFPLLENNPIYSTWNSLSNIPDMKQSTYPKWKQTPMLLNLAPSSLNLTKLCIPVLPRQLTKNAEMWKLPRRVNSLDRSPHLQSKALCKLLHNWDLPENLLRT